MTDYSENRLSEVRALDPLWGAKAIAHFINTSVEVVYHLADDPDAPVYKPRGRYCAFKPELLAWMKTKPTKSQT